MPEFGALESRLRDPRSRGRRQRSRRTHRTGARAAYFRSPSAQGADARIVGGAGFAPLIGGDADTCELRKMYFLPELRAASASAEISATLAWTARAPRAFAACKNFRTPTAMAQCARSTLEERLRPPRRGARHNRALRLQLLLRTRAVARLVATARRCRTSRVAPWSSMTVPCTPSASMSMIVAWKNAPEATRSPVGRVGH